MKQLTTKVVAVVGTLSLSLAVATIAYASPPARSHQDSSTTTTTTMTPAQQYRQQMVTYHNSEEAIRMTFQASVASAQAAYHSAIAQNPSSASRAAARAALQVALAQAVTTRDSALAALGQPPARP